MLPAVGPGGVVAMRAGTVILRACHRRRTWVIVGRPPGFCDLPAAAVNLWSEWARVTSGDSSPADQKEAAMRRAAGDLYERFTAFVREHGKRHLRVARPRRPPPVTNRGHAASREPLPRPDLAVWA